MNQSKTSLIWTKLLVDGKKYATRDDIADIAEAIGKKVGPSIDYLQHERYIHRIFRGLFYISSPNEREFGCLDRTIYELVAESLKLKGVDRWYFGLETALDLNLMTHEHFIGHQVITDSMKTTKAIGVMGSPIRFLAWSPKLFVRGSTILTETKNGVSLFHSDKEKTALDLAYKGHLIGYVPDAVRAVISEYSEQLDLDKLEGYLYHYPPRFVTILQGPHGQEVLQQARRVDRLPRRRRSGTGLSYAYGPRRDRRQ